MPRGGGVAEPQLLAALVGQEPGLPSASSTVALRSVSLFCCAGLFSRLRGLTLATVGESRTCVGVSGGLAWWLRLAECWQTGVVTGELRTRCTTMGEEGVSSERMAAAGERGCGVGEPREEPEESEPTGAASAGAASAGSALTGSGEGTTPSVANLYGGTVDS